MRRYDYTQQKNRALLEERKQEVRDKIPKFQENEAFVSKLSLHIGKGLVSGEQVSFDDYKSKIKKYEYWKTTMLIKAGFPKDYLDPIYTCKDCQDSGYMGNQKCHCFHKIIIEYLYQQSNLQEILEQENFQHLSLDFYSHEVMDPKAISDLSARENAELIVNSCKKFVEEFRDTPRNILLYGDTGTGKTFLSNCIAKELMDQEYSVLYFSATQFFDLMSRSKFGRLETHEDDITPYVYSCDLLIIDDIGTEITNSVVSSIFFDCLNQRLNTRRSMILSMNLSISELKKIYSERILSRIMNNFSMLRLFGNDIRLQKRILRTQQGDNNND